MKQQNKSLWQLSLFTVVGALLFCSLSNVSAQTVPQIAEKALAATVSLEMQDRSGTILGQGSGFFVRHKKWASACGEGRRTQARCINRQADSHV